MQGLYLLLKSYFFPRCSLGYIKSSPRCAHKAAIGYSHCLWVTPFFPGAWASLGVCLLSLELLNGLLHGPCWVSRALLGSMHRWGLALPETLCTPQHRWAPRSPQVPVKTAPSSQVGQRPGGSPCLCHPDVSLSRSLHLKRKTRTQAMHLLCSPNGKVSIPFNAPKGGSPPTCQVPNNPPETPWLG